jgi:hypothetical protein
MNLPQELGKQVGYVARLNELNHQDDKNQVELKLFSEPRPVKIRQVGARISYPAPPLPRWLTSGCALLALIPSKSSRGLYEFN